MENSRFAFRIVRTFDLTKVTVRKQLIIVVHSFTDMGEIEASMEIEAGGTFRFIAMTLDWN